MTRGLGVHADCVVCYKDTTPWLIYMQDTDPTNWKPVRSNAKYGASSHFSICDYETYQMYMGRNIEGAVNFAALEGGVQSADIAQLTVNGIVADSKSDKIEPDVRLFARNEISRIFGIRFDNKLWYAVPYGISATSNTRVYVFDYFQRDKSRASGAWWPMEYPFDPTYFTIYNGSLYCAVSDATGYVYRFDVSNLFSDDGSAIDSYFYTKEFEGKKGHEEHHKDFRRLNMTMGTPGNWDMGVTWFIDSDTGSGTPTLLNVSPGGSLWGSMVWGSSTWGGGTTRKRFPIELGTASGTRIQFKFDNENTSGRAFEILRGAFYYNDRGRR
jgi:hypothetical protein